MKNICLFAETVANAHIFVMPRWADQFLKSVGLLYRYCMAAVQSRAWT
jgi:hypothetical protein